MSYMQTTQTIDYWIGLKHGSGSIQDILVVNTDEKFNPGSMEYVWGANQPNGRSGECMFIHGYANPKHPDWGIGWHDIRCNWSEIYALCEKRK